MQQDFSDPRDADDARYSLNVRHFDGSRLLVEFARGVSSKLISLIECHKLYFASYFAFVPCLVYIFFGVNRNESSVRQYVYFIIFIMDVGSTWPWRFS